MFDFITAIIIVVIGVLLNKYIKLTKKLSLRITQLENCLSGVETTNTSTKKDFKEIPYVASPSTQNEVEKPSSHKSEDTTKETKIHDKTLIYRSPKNKAKEIHSHPPTTLRFNKFSEREKVW